MLIEGEGQIDLGGMAKGYLIDEVVSLLRKEKVPQALINAGGRNFCLGGKKQRWEFVILARRKHCRLYYN